MTQRIWKHPFSNVFVGAWLLLTLSLAIWWMIHGLAQIGSLSQAGSRIFSTVEIERQHRMLLWEGISFLTLLIIGGAALFWFNDREKKRVKQIQTFFATFTHELKTPLASLRLQAESLQEDLTKSPLAPVVDRLVKDTIRLEVQLENALFLATYESTGQIHVESLSLRSLLSPLQNQLRDISIEMDGNCQVRADRRALESILKNLVQNSRIHGKATLLKINPEQKGNSVLLTFEDNGRGLQGAPRKVGELFSRPNSSSGSGVGLFLCKALAERMHGKIELSPGIPFRVRLQLPGEVQ